MKKTFFMIVTIIVLISTLSVTTFAWENTNTVSGTITFNSNQGCAEMQVTGKFVVTKIEGTIIVYKKVGSSWIYVTETSKIVAGRSCSIELYFDAQNGYEYKADCTFIVYKGTNGEVIQETMSKVFT